MVSMTFDLSKPTVGDLRKILPGVKAVQMTAMAELVAKVAVSCPPEWGEPDKAITYSRQAFREVLAPAWKALIAESSALDVKIEGLEFGLENITPEQFDRLVKDMDSNNPEKMAGTLSQFVSKLPKAWGDPKNPDTYLKLHYYTEFLPLAKAFTRAGVDEMQNFLKLLTSE